MPGPRPTDLSKLPPFGRLTAVGPDPDRPRHWLCVCACGKGVSVRSDSLVQGHTVSCGCGKTDPAWAARLSAVGVAARKRKARRTRKRPPG